MEILLSQGRCERQVVVMVVVVVQPERVGEKSEYSHKFLFLFFCSNLVRFFLVFPLFFLFARAQFAKRMQRVQERAQEAAQRAQETVREAK
jgi:hypothetical protein